jgi:hypothetical protein
MSKGGSGSSMTQAGGQSSFGGQMPMQQQGYQSPFGNQNYRSQPSQPAFNNYSYQQPGQFGGQIMNQSMRSPGSKGGYSAPVMQQPMRSPGGKGRSYQPPPTPYGYGQSTFNPGQFGGYGQPSNMFSFSSPHYQPYVPPVYEPPPPPPPPYRGDDPRDSGVTSSPPSTGSKGGTQRPMPDYSSSGVTGYQPSFGAKGGYQPSFGGKGGYYQNAEQPPQAGETVQQPVQQPPEERVFTPPPLGNNPPPPPDYGFTPPRDEPISAPPPVTPPPVASPPSFSGTNQDFINDFDMRMREPFMPKTIHSAPVNFGSEYSKAPAQPAVGPPITRGNNPPVNPLRSEFTQPTTQPTTQPPVVNSRPIYSNNPPIAPDYGFTQPTQPPAPVNNQTLTPVMPKPTPPTRDVPLFPSVGGIGGGQSFVGGFIPTGPEPRFRTLDTNDLPRPIFSDMSAEQKEQEEKYRAAQAKKPRYFDNVTGKPVTQSEYDALGGNKQPTGGPQTLMQGEQNQYGTAEDELLERNIKNMGPGSFDDTSLFDMLRKSSGGIGSLMGLSGLPGRSESFTPPKNPLDILLAERGFQVPERNLISTQDHVQFGADPVTGLMRFGGSSDRGYYRKLDEMYAQNPEALEIAKQYHADQLKKAKESAQGGIFDQTPLKQITYSPKQPVPQRDMNMGLGSFGIPLGRLR